MSCVLFAGPTLAAQDRALLPEAVWLPPARQGDVHRAVSLLRPRVIGIVDGYFQWTPAVWHKEILWALHEGVHVFGAASMGALRAAELEPFGMRGVGRVFEAYRRGTLPPYAEAFEDDDEVAVVHGPEESGYLAASEAMVNIRVTLARAEAAGILTAAERDRLAAIAKAMFFPQRSYDAMLDAAAREGVSPAVLERLRAWLPSGRVNQKRDDALALLAAVRACLDADPSPLLAGFAFEHTEPWHESIVSAAPARSHEEDDQFVLDEFRLCAGEYLDERADVTRALFGLDAGAGCAARADDTGDGRTRLDRLARQRAVQAAQREVPPLLLDRQLLARLRSDGRYATLLQRARSKADCVARQRDLPDVAAFADLQLLQLEDWYFSHCLDAEMPDDRDGFVRAVGYPDLASFHRALLQEYVYRHALDEAAPAAVEHSP